MAIQEFAVFNKFRGVLASRSEPVGLIVLSDDKIEIYSFQQSWKKRWKNYFESGNFMRHMSSASPLASMFASPYGAPDVFPYSEQHQWMFDSAKKYMTGKPIIIDLKKGKADNPAGNNK